MNLSRDAILGGSRDALKFLRRGEIVRTAVKNIYATSVKEFYA